MNLISIIFLRLFGLVLICLFFKESLAMLYNEPLNIDDLDQYFSEDGCIEGFLSVSEVGSPTVKSLYSELDDSFISKSSGNNTFDDKSAMSLLHELSVFNGVKYLYNLTDEEGPPHMKQFVVSLMLGQEKYIGEGTSIKKAQHAAAKLALESTLYEHPPKKPKNDKIPKKDTTHVQRLDSWAVKNNIAPVIYTFTEKFSKELSGDDNHYHEGMYSKDFNIRRVVINVGGQEFTGEGSTLDSAKQNAAEHALTQMQKTDGFCMLEDSFGDIVSRILNSGSGNESPVSFIFQFSSKSKLSATFDLIREEGPSHLKMYGYKCKVGQNFESYGEGTSKKEAKKEAAEKMVDILKNYASYSSINCKGLIEKKKKKKKNKSTNLVKSAKENYYDKEVKSDYSFPQDLNPISKLIQILQMKYDVEPIFSLVDEKGKTNKEFFMEVKVGDLSFVGSGRNKKAAKRKAAEGMLEKLGYSVSYGKERIFSDKKRRAFVDVDGDPTKKRLLPGLNLNSNKFVPLNEGSEFSNSHMEPKEQSAPTHHTKPNHPSNSERNSPDLKPHTSGKQTHQTSDQKSSNIKPKSELSNLAQQMNFKFQFSDFPKVNNSGFVTLLSLTTNPSLVCYGVGKTTFVSQDNAALTALKNLYKRQLNTISEILQEPNQKDLAKEQFNMVEDIEIKTTIVKETE